MHDVEPAAGLTGVLHDKIRRRVGLKPLLVLKRVVLLRERHGTGLEPAVQHVRYATHRGLARRIVRVRASQLIDVRAVQAGRTHAEVTLQLIQGTVDIHARVLRIIGDPRRDRSAPVAGAGDIPITSALQPLAKLAVADVLRQPLDLIMIELHHAVTELRHLDEPCRQRHVDEWFAGAPGMRVGVLDGHVAHHAASSLEVLDDGLVSVEDQLALIRRYLRGELAIFIHRDDQAYAVLLAGEHIVLTEGRSLVDNTGAILGGDVIREQQLVRVLDIREEIEDGLVLKALQLRALERLEDLRLTQLLRQSAGECLGHHKGTASKVALSSLKQHVVDLRMDRQSQVGWQGPGGGGPSEEGGVGKLSVIRQRLLRSASLDLTSHWESHRQGRVLAHLIRIIQACFLVGQRGVLSPGIRQNPKALVDQALVIELLKRPHDRLHVLQVHGSVAVFKVHPASLAVNILFPLIGVLENGLGAVFVELL